MAEILKFINPGVETYTVPAGVNAILVHLWGAGGSNGQRGGDNTVQTGTETYTYQVTINIPGTSGTPAVPAGSQSFRSAGTYEFIVPNFGGTLQVTVVGGGGGGGTSNPAGTGGTGGTSEAFGVSATGGSGGTGTGTHGGSYGTGRPGGSGRGGDNNYTGATTPHPSGAGGGSQIAGGASGLSAGGAGNGGISGGTYYGSSWGYCSAGAGGGAAVKTFREGTLQPGSRVVVTVGAGGSSAGSSGGKAAGRGNDGAVIISWGGRAGTPGTPASTRTETRTGTRPVYTTYNGGQGGQGAAGAYAFQRIKVVPGDIITFITGARGLSNQGGASSTLGFNFAGGNGSGGGGGASVVLKNGQIVAVAGGGGGGGGGAPATSSQGQAGGNGVPGGIYNTQEKTLYNGQNALSRGGGGGGGFYGGTAGADVNSVGSGGRGGGSVGEIILPGSGRNAAGQNTTYFSEASRRGNAELDGAIIAEFELQLSLAIKVNNSWSATQDQFVKVNNVWKEIYMGWTKVSGQWKPLQYDTDVNLTPVTYSLSSNVASINEGQTVGFTLTSTGLPSGAALAYTASGINQSDLDAGNLTGTFIVGVTPTITFTPKTNFITNGQRTLAVRINNTQVTANCIINDTSVSSVYSISANVATVNEGQAVRFTLVGTTNPRTGDIVRYDITSGSSDLVSGTPTSGNFIWGSVQTVDVALSQDLSTESTEQLTMRISGKNTSTASVNVSIIDTSTTPAGSNVWATSGTYSWEVPTGIRKIRVDITGGGGGAGSGDLDGGFSVNNYGLPGKRLKNGVLDVTPGETLTLYVGAGGQGGWWGDGGAHTMTTTFGYGIGGRGGRQPGSGGMPASGGGGSAILRSTTPIIIAGGGGGGAPSNKTGATFNLTPRYVDSGIDGENGPDSTGDNRAPGPGGGGGWFGGKAGPAPTNDAGSTTASSGRSLIPPGFEETFGTNQGKQGYAGSNRNVIIGNGQPGSITIEWGPNIT